ncbi:nitroreductase family protein [Nocardia cerradoensis]|uniref:Coenzyme F420:L-glutamate ligase n=1 Tax=Nocardia cerradoensis TaxID=85688 RepID=A0A231GV01_9NOCA|nr:nitroreductase family protein [Nocardia cerradoensis]NKY43614.1 nitroreductase family protein [Nocardia cerradoensis]OXR40457.1 Coenzyme F420:L-glutamate ligase [Nocardia cerradoensis]
MELETALTTTRTVRKRLDLSRPVPRKVVDQCLRLALQAPNGSNRQLWHWVMVDDPAVRAQVSDLYRDGLAEAMARSDMRNPDPAQSGRTRPSVEYLGEHLHEVPMLAIPVLKCDMRGMDVFMQASRWGSVIPAVWSFMLALRERGLGSAWTTVHLLRERQTAELLGIPDGYTQVGLFPIAYTLGTDFKPASRRPVEEVSSWNLFEEVPSRSG